MATSGRKAVFKKGQGWAWPGGGGCSLWPLLGLCQAFPGLGQSPAISSLFPQPRTKARVQSSEWPAAPTTSPSIEATQETYTLAHEENVRFVSEGSFEAQRYGLGHWFSFHTVT